MKTGKIFLERAILACKKVGNQIKNIDAAGGGLAASVTLREPSIERVGEGSPQTRKGSDCAEGETPVGKKKGKGFLKIV